MATRAQKIGRHAPMEGVPPLAEDMLENMALGPETRLVIQSEDEFFASVRRQLDQLDKGAAEPFRPTVSFESLATFLEVLTPKRAELVERVVAEGRFESMRALATILHRDESTVRKDVTALAAAGLLRVVKDVLPGHGKRSVVLPAVQSIAIEFGGRPADAGSSELISA